MRHFILKNLGIIFIIIHLFSSHYGLGQDFSYRKAKFEWKVQNLPVIPVNEQFKNEDAVILKEQCSYNIGGNRVPLYSYLAARANYFTVDDNAYSDAPIVQKHLRVKYLTKQGIQKYSTFNLPESFDPKSDEYYVRTELRDSVIRPKGEFKCIRYFAARIIKSDGSIQPANIIDEAELEMHKVNHINQKNYVWKFHISNLVIGDELELDYAYEGVYNNEPSSRIFFNGVLPKQQFELTVKYPSTEPYILWRHNGAEPYDSTLITKSKPAMSEFYFKAENLIGGITEAGARPHMDLPYITYYKHKDDYGILDPKTRFVTKRLPYPWDYILMPLINFRYDDLNLHLIKLDRTTRALNSFVAQQKQKLKDSSYVNLMNSLHQSINSEFTYDGDADVISGDDGKLEKLGKNVEEKNLHSLSRMRLYRELLDRLDTDYYMFPVFDNRFNTVDPNMYEALVGMRVGYALNDDGYIFMYYPKSYRQGYEVNEFPFYYESIPTVLIPQHLPVEYRTDLAPNLSFLHFNIPSRDPALNVRKTSAMVNVSLDDMTVAFNGRLSLSGQFSTLTRGYYLYGECDTTINISYYSSICDLADERTPIETVLSDFNTHFPFEAKYNIAFKANHCMKKLSATDYSIDLNGWFNNVVDQNFDGYHRHLDYYPDFTGHDIHRYMFKFDHKIKVVDIDQYTNSLNNSYADYSFHISQPDEQSLVLECSSSVKSKKIPADKAMDVQSVNDLIRKVNTKSLLVQRVE